MYTHITSLIALSLLAVNTCALPDDQYQAIEILANHAMHDEKKGLSTYQGNVVVTQGSMKLEADEVRVSRDASLVEAVGNPARFQQQPDADKPVIEAEARDIHYATSTGKIELSGNVQLRQGDARVASERIVYSISEQVFSASSAKGSNTQNPSQRVQVIIPPQQRPEANNP